MSKRLWEAAYYPNMILEDKRARAILCLLFDRIVCHFPITDMACGGGSGISDLFSDDPLVKAGIIKLEEKILLPEIDVNYWEDFDKFEKLQVTTMALQKCQQESLIPVTDNVNFRIPAFVLNRIDTFRFAGLQAASIAISSIDIVLPSIGGIEDEDILILRDELIDELVPFRRNMFKLAPLVRQYIDEDATVKEIYVEAKYVTETCIIPALEELRNRIEREKGILWRRLLLKSGVILPKFIMNWTQKSIISAALDSLNDFSELAALGINGQLLIENMKREGGFGFLLSLEKLSENR